MLMAILFKTVKILLQIMRSPTILKIFSKRYQKIFDKQKFQCSSFVKYLNIILFFYLVIIHYQYCRCFVNYNNFILQFMEEDVPLPKEQIDPNYILISLRVSKCYLYFHVFQIMLAFALLFCLIANLWQITPFLELVTSFLLSIDLLIKYLSEGKRTFMEGKKNFVDVAVLLMIMTIFLADLFFPNIVHNSEGFLSLAVLGGCYLIQIWRVFTLSKQSKKEIQINRLEAIKFINTVDDESRDVFCH